MNIFDLLTQCTQAGLWLQWTGSKVKAIGGEYSLQKLLPLLKSHKQALQEFFQSDEGQAYEERAAIMEYDGGMTRTEAEAKVLAELQQTARGQNND